MKNININKNSNQSGRKECMECSADTKLFFDNVYKSGTRGKKQQIDVLQYGRSMIEMLGVLAIVGVLSVGGIAGYSKAMEKFKINKTINQMSQIITNIRTLYAQQTTYDGIGQVLHLIVPDDMEGNPNEYMGLKNAFGGPVFFGIPYDTPNAVYISFGNMPNQACLNIASLDWGSQDGIVGIAVGHGYISWGSRFDDMLVDNCSDGTYSGGGHASQAGLYTCSSSIPVAKIASQIPNWTQYDDDIRYGCHVMFKVK